jgi:DNA-binding transcriptional LysR family regulator
MDTALLRAFLLVARYGNLTRAAQEFGISQPGLSRQMARLEADLSVALFERSRAGLTLTAAGQRYRQFAEDVLVSWQQMLDDIHGASATVEGDLRIGASTTPAEFIVPSAVAAFTQRHPQVRPLVITSDTQAVVDGLRQGRWELGVVGAQVDEPGVHYVSIADDEIVLAVPTTHPFARRRMISLDDLAGQRFVLREGGSGTLLSVERALAAHNLALPPLQIVMTLSTTQAVVSAVQHGYGMGFVSSLAITEHNGSRLAAVRLVEVRMRRQLSLVWLAHRPLSQQAHRFVEYLLQRMPRGQHTQALAQLDE